MKKEWTQSEVEELEYLFNEKGDSAIEEFAAKSGRPKSSVLIKATNIGLIEVTREEIE